MCPLELENIHYEERKPTYTYIHVEGTFVLKYLNRPTNLEMD